MTPLKKVPYAVFILLFFQFLFFFTVLLGNQSVRQNTIDYYFDSGLHRIEFPMYYRFLQKHMSNNIYYSRLENISSGSLNSLELYWLIFFDPFFQNELESGSMLKNSNEYHLWSKKRAAYAEYIQSDHLLNTTFNSAEPKPANILFSLFSTENIIQFWINVIFLIIVGMLLQTKIGTLLIIESYLLGGILMISSYCLLAPFSLIPVAGSNGGIASMIGLMTGVLFDRKTLSFTSALSVIIILVWIIVQYFLYSFLKINTINVMTQIPALVGGAVIGIYLRGFNANNGAPELQEEKQKDQA